jgi:membrane protein
VSEDQRHIRIAIFVQRFLSTSTMRRAVAGPGDGFTARDWVVVLQRVRKEAKEDNVGLVAAGVAFWAILSIIPLLVGIMAVGVLVAGPAQVHEQLGPLAGILPGPVARSLTDQLSDAAATMSGKGKTLGLVIGLLGVLWTCSRGISAVISGLHIVIDETETRSVVRRRATAFVLAIGAVTAVLGALALVSAVPHVALHQADVVLAFGIRCVILALLAVVGLILLYRYGPDRRDADWHAVRWGAGIAMVCWLVMSLVLGLYVADTGGRSSTYGTLAGVAAVATWLYMSSYIVLLGAEINAEIERLLARRSVMRDEPAKAKTQPEKPVEPAPSPADSPPATAASQPADPNGNGNGNGAKHLPEKPGEPVPSTADSLPATTASRPIDPHDNGPKEPGEQPASPADPSPASPTEPHGARPEDPPATPPDTPRADPQGKPAVSA